MTTIISRKPRSIIKMHEQRSFFRDEIEREFERIRVLVEQAASNGLIDPDLLREVDGYRRIRAKIYFYLPDHHETLLGEFIWANQDRPPKLPVLHRLLDYWQTNLDGKVKDVQVDDAEFKPQVWIPGWRPETEQTVN